jgi:uncharacterized protein YecE (DUF72 family)
MAASVLIGTSGWSYPSGPGTWNGVFYPPRAARGFRAGDELRYYAEHFDTVEVNSTFYRPPDASVARRWVEQTPAAFQFSVKLYQSFTHAMMRGRGTTGTPRPSGASPIPDPSPADVEAFRGGLEPIAASGKLGMLLVQFPSAYHRTAEARDYLATVLGAFHDYPLAVELRHRTWSDAAKDTNALLDEFNATWVQIDEPKFRSSIRQDPRQSGRSGYYLRLHGRNAASWWTHDDPDDRYNYLYSADELQHFADAVAAGQAPASSPGGSRPAKAYVYLNNHFAAKAVVNATILKQQLGQPVKGEYREELLERYPELRDIVAERKTRDGG